MYLSLIWSINNLNNNKKKFVHSKTNQQQTKQKSNLEYINENWADLSHDTDVNHLPNVARPTRDESKDIEVFYNNKYISLNDIDNYRENYNIDTENLRKVNTDSVKRKKRETNDVLISKDDIINAKIDFHNSINAKEVHIENHREKRETSSNDELISKEDIINAKIDLHNSVNVKEVHIENHTDALITVRKERQVDYTSVKAFLSEPVIVVDGLRVENSEKEPDIIEESIPSVLADTGVTIRYVSVLAK